ncbi:MAG: hemerythrin domain-containing protein [Gemmatimonadota bacterium]
MNARTSTGVLRAEHQRILQVVAVLEPLLEADPGLLDLATIGKCVRFFRLFADACHHGKEEGLLFPALEARGMPHDAGPIAVMLHEHRLGRHHVAAMAAALGEGEGHAVDAAGLVRAGRDYIELIRGHILKEDHVLFEMADQMVVGPPCDRLCAAYASTADDRYEGCTRVQLEALGDEIVETAS